jgi:hypothetical protein
MLVIDDEASTSYADIIHALFHDEKVKNKKSRVG